MLLCQGKIIRRLKASYWQFVVDFNWHVIKLQDYASGYVLCNIFSTFLSSSSLSIGLTQYSPAPNFSEFRAVSRVGYPVSIMAFIDGEMLFSFFSTSMPLFLLLKQ